MYRTLTHGSGQMPPQPGMVPSAEVRRDPLRPRDVPQGSTIPSQYRAVDRGYLAGLPKGKTHGPSPRAFRAVEGDGLRVDPDGDRRGRDAGQLRLQGSRRPARPRPRRRLARAALGGVRPRHDAVGGRLERARASSTGTGSTSTAGTRSIPETVGKVALRQPARPRLGRPADRPVRRPAAAKGRDGRPYGPLPAQWARYKGLYHHGDRAILALYRRRHRGPRLARPPRAGSLEAKHADLHAIRSRSARTRHELPTPGRPRRGGSAGIITDGPSDAGRRGRRRSTSRVPAVATGSTHSVILMTDGDGSALQPTRSSPHGPLTPLTHGGPLAMARGPEDVAITRPGRRPVRRRYRSTHPAKTTLVVPDAAHRPRLPPRRPLAAVCNWDGDVWLVDGLDDPRASLRGGGSRRACSSRSA